MFCVKEEQHCCFGKTQTFHFKPIWWNMLFKHYFTNIIHRVKSNNSGTIFLNSPFLHPYSCKSALYHILFISLLNVKVLTRFLNETIITNKQLMTWIMQDYSHLEQRCDYRTLSLLCLCKQDTRTRSSLQAVLLTMWS